jgi:uncharacterized membrane protein YjgN (DUF898 family)
MSNPQFNIILKGILPGFDAPKAQADFTALFSLDAQKTASLFASENSVLKANVSQDVADKYLIRLAAIGVSVVAEAIGGEEPTEINDLFEDEGINQQSNQDNESCVVIEKSPLAVTQEFPKISVENGSLKRQKHNFVFTGNGTEYFKIWIVNILLSIVTLGIYSAWAKVRNKQYFYGNTHIADHTFEYTAEPIKILKGRAIAFLIYLAVVFSHHISPLASVIATVVFLVFLPFIIVNSLRFNARHSSYRNIPFRFTGTVWGALKVFILLPLAGIFTVGLLMPLAWKRQTQYLTNNHYYGSEVFHFDADIKDYFFMLMILAAVSVGFFVVLVGIIAAGSVATVFAGASFDPKSWLFVIPMIVGYLAFYLALGAYYFVTMANIHWNNAKLKNHQFAANWKTFSYFTLLSTNTFGILFTLGLYIPFAKVRTAIYKANHTALIAEGSLDNFIANELEQSNSLAEGVHDIFDIDISI